MKGIIIAAGPSTRLRPLTESMPKCMLKIEGKPIIEHTLEVFRNNRIQDISVVVGYRKEEINVKGVTFFENRDFWDNNILHSLMHAREKFEESMSSNEDVVISYSDIWFNDIVMKTLVQNKNDISVVTDTDWESNYEGRTDHPISEAENVVMDDNKRILKIGKRILNDKVPSNNHAEFIGLWKFTPTGVKIFLNHFDRLNSFLKKTDPYQNAREWQKSYITDILQEMIDRGENVYCAEIKKNWNEFDTLQDYSRVN
jgi:L-glutamine-phosphate cytidylyltransferase